MLSFRILHQGSPFLPFNNQGFNLQVCFTKSTLIRSKVLALLRDLSACGPRINLQVCNYSISIPNLFFTIGRTLPES